MKDAELDRAMYRLLRPRRYLDPADFSPTYYPSDAHWTIEAMKRRGFSARLNYGTKSRPAWICAFSVVEDDGLDTAASWRHLDDTRKLTFSRAVSEAALRALRARKAAKKST
jgi:hypothetical protein